MCFICTTATLSLHTGAYGYIGTKERLGYRTKERVTVVQILLVSDKVNVS